MNLTYRYSAIQFTHWASSSGAAAFATTYLLNKGVPSGMVGIPAGIGRALFLSVTASSGISGRPRRKICPDKNAADHVCSVQCMHTPAVTAGNFYHADGCFVHGQYLEQ